ncbi:outer membrane autotransporter [Conexibacter woesei DSM 14684]|uniref:Outer membrane autotransporter n=1 Tax=Conexibacter woesei (strain DSM 14684 / CCUG 47730 / CIP 108061 / JCM 11494 / NBRC 100937 / ID131577) TaxID=469383 RepID=D3FA26_CONWI|nr:outer membrane autotransporter [Conexibacter woesei DSM 14684]
MKPLSRLAAATALAIAATLVIASSAAATITFPYSTTSGTGSFNTISSIGNGSCVLSGIRASSSSSSAASVTGFTASACRGTIVSAAYTVPITLTIALPGGAISDVISILIVNILGGHCLYSGTFTGTANGTSTKSVSGTATLIRTLRGICTPTATGNLSITLPGARIG